MSDWKERYETVIGLEVHTGRVGHHHIERVLMVGGTNDPTSSMDVQVDAGHFGGWLDDSD